jgi:hypothetical protein
MWSKKPIKSSPTIVASAVLVGAVMVLISPLHSTQEAIARAATRAAEVVTEEAQIQAILVDRLVSEPLPPPGL